ncbi:hypothetical protein [Nodularia spumigena]|uniref:hypothetical protein n=1 Tax=Nodularia spumigena TaxID=70799 RepID=UPI00233065A9|nr:hypothetical protein [Nodularia spumigena]
MQSKRLRLRLKILKMQMEYLLRVRTQHNREQRGFVRRGKLVIEVRSPDLVVAWQG